MIKMKNKVIRKIAAFTAVIMTVLPTAAFAEKKPLSEGELKALFVQDVAEHLGVYSAYEDVVPYKLYKSALLSVIERHPEMYEAVMTGMLESIDEYSEYYNETDSKLLTETITGTIVGIGITFQMGPDGVDVVSVIPNTSAASAGLEVGDVIVSADDVILEGMNSDTAATYIRGEEGTTLKLGIKKKDSNRVIYVNVVRDQITQTSVTHKQLADGENEAMYICVHGFISNTAEEFKAALDTAAAAGIENIIIDVRDNGGGLFDQAIKMADYIVPKGSTITTEDHKADILNVVYKAELDDEYKFNVIMLINENSASASEVLTAALYENDCAKLIGQKTYGKGTIQTVTNLVYGDSMKYTVGFYLTPKGNNINGIGIEPDYYVENSITPFEIEKYEKFSYEKRYYVGDSGAEVKTAKELLKAWGLYKGEIDDVYDEALEKAVFLFQNEIGLYPYGVLDITTQHQLYTRLEKSKVEHDDQLNRALEEFGIKIKE